MVLTCRALCPVVSGGAELMRSTIAAIGPAALSTAVVGRQGKAVTALGIFNAKKSHDSAPFPTMGPYPAMAVSGDHMSHFVGYGLGDKRAGLQSCDVEVVAQSDLLAPAPYNLAGHLATQAEIEPDLWRPAGSLAE